MKPQTFNLYLIVDDIVINRTILSKMIKKIDPESFIIEADSGKQAIEIFNNCHDSKYVLSCVFMDYNLLDMLGTEVLNELNKIHKHNTNKTLAESGIKEIMITANHELTTEQLTEQCQLFFKPISMIDVFTMIQSNE